LRLRPILMTSFAFILGVLPLVIAKGAGAEMDQAEVSWLFFKARTSAQSESSGPRKRRRKTATLRGTEIISGTRSISFLEIPFCMITVRNHRKNAATLPPSTVVTSPVVFIANAWWTNACATSSAVTSHPRRLPDI
jgi:hypothetical protein